MASSDLPDQLRQLCGVLRATNRHFAAEHELQPVHLDVLRYLSRCNRYSNTPVAISQYLQTTKGTVSQSINVLERKKLIAKLADSKDKRVVRLRLLDKGRRLVRKLDDNHALTSAIEGLGDRTRRSFQETVVELLRSAQRINEYQSFGQCRSCRFFRRLPDGGYQCGVTREALSDADTELICVEHEYPG